MLAAALQANPDPWLTGFWLPIIDILATAFLGVAAIAIAISSSRKDRDRTNRKERSDFASELEDLLTRPNSFGPSIKSLRTRASALDPPASNVVAWVESHLRLIGFPYGSVSSGMYGGDNRIRFLRAELGQRLRVWVETGVFDSGTLQLPPLDE